MKPFFKSKAGLISIIAFALLMGLVLHRVANRRRDRLANPAMAAKVVPPAGRLAAARDVAAARRPAPVAESAAYLEPYYDLDRRSHNEHDQQGNRVTKRATAVVARVQAGAWEDAPEGVREPVAAVATRTSLRLQGRPAAGGASPAPSPVEMMQPKLEHLGGSPASPADAPPPGLPREQAKPRPQRFSPYGRVVKCELVFTIDSTSEQCPLVCVVMEPVYNNGALIIPASAELHGVARPDRLRDRIFSGQDWVLVFPREPDRVSGRQLNVKGVALDRVEPDANGMTWGITDGSYGLEGRVIRTMNDEEIKRFVATFLAGSSVALQDRNTDRTGQQSVRNTPQNAVLQGLAANFEKIAEDISSEIAQHGVFIRVPAGHQFYFYPTQIIDPDAAGVSSDVATVK